MFFISLQQAARACWPTRLVILSFLDRCWAATFGGPMTLLIDGFHGDFMVIQWDYNVEFMELQGKFNLQIWRLTMENPYLVVLLQ